MRRVNNDSQSARKQGIGVRPYRGYYLHRYGADVSCMVAGLLAGTAAVPGGTLQAALRQFTLFALHGAIVLSMLESSGIYAAEARHRFKTYRVFAHSGAAVLKATCFGWAAVVVLTFLLGIQPLLSVGLLVSVLASFGSMAGWRILSRGQNQSTAEEALRSNVIVLGTERTLEPIEEHLAAHPELHLHVVERVDAIRQFGNCAGSEMCEWLLATAHAHFSEEVVLCGLPSELAERVIEAARQIGLAVRVIPDVFGDSGVLPATEFLGGIPSFCSNRKPKQVGAALAKRALDIGCAVFALVLLLPVFLAIILLIKIGSPGPILYRSQRVGRKGRTFWCWKFRTMVVNADALKENLKHLNERDGVLFKISNDPRITLLGRYLRKYSLDELPQIVNVLKGDMSLVGPRPPIAAEVAQYQGEQRLRLAVTPGITGLWQVEARANPSFDRYMELDLQYVREWNLMLDLRILLRTVRVVFAGTGQ